MNRLEENRYDENLRVVVAERIIGMQKADFKLRDELIHENYNNETYHPLMEQMHNLHADELEYIISLYGYPTIERMGEEACEAAWLIIQHAIGRPGFMKRCLRLIKDAVESNNAPAWHYAYLSDRLAVMEEKPQLYGTHYDWDENLEMSILPVDDVVKVNERRKSLGMNSIEDRQREIREQILLEGRKPPQDLLSRKVALASWKRRVGWKAD